MIRDRTRDRVSEIGVINGVARVSAMIANLVAQLDQKYLQIFLELESTMIGADCYDPARSRASPASLPFNVDVTFADYVACKRRKPHVLRNKEARAVLERSNVVFGDYRFGRFIIRGAFRRLLAVLRS